MVQFHALGALTITDDGDEVSIGGPRQRRLVAMLLIHRNSVVSVDRLNDAVFAGEPTPGASTTLRSYVARMRKAVERGGSAATVVTQAPGYMLRLPDESFDVARFEGLLVDGGSRLAHDDAAGASSVFGEALALWRGQAYAEFADEDWARPEAQRLGELRVVACERLVDAELACGRAAVVIPQIEALTAEHPLREAFRVQLMIAFYRTGRQADALRIVREYRQVLVEELGLDPSPVVTDVERRILNHDPTLMLAEPGGVPLRGYRLGERLGTGRDGTVYAARLPGVEREFAIRVIRQDVADDPEFVRSFEATAHRVASLRHPAVVAIHDYWREPGAAYVVMRRMHGGTLRDRLHRGPLTTGAAATLASRIGGALVAAADGEIVHGRIVPESVLFDDSGEPCLADFVLDPAGRSQTSSEDVHDFTLLIGECLAAGGSGDGRLAGVPVAVADVLARGTSTAGRPPMAEFVPMLVAALAGAQPGVASPSNPFKGLRAFDEADAADFFGRRDLIDEVLTRLAHDDQRGRLVLVVGGSGTGKSSVVRAGLLPRVRHGDVPGSQHWFVTTMLPGGSPFKELGESLRRVAVGETTGLADELAAEQGIDRVVRRLVPGDGQLLLVVDQFEELFTLASEPDRRAFLDGVMHAVSVPDSRLRVVATLRADFYDRPLAVQRFGAAVNEATVTIAAMSPAELEAAIVEPAERVGGQVEGALVAELVNSVVDEPAALPSLQFTLYELAERSPDKRLTLAAYRELGGVDGAIASRAELVYRGLDDDERTAVRQMFERLVVVSSEGEPTRRRAARTELAGIAGSSADAAVDRWAQARLLTLDRHPQTRVPTVELAHEALLREWPRLRRWIEDDREAIIVLGHLRDAAATWEELERDTGALYRGARLEVALDVADGRSHELPELEREFLDASRDARDREQRQEAERAARQVRANRRLRIQLAAIAIALVVALVGGFIALDQRRNAEQERRVATARELATAADANVDDDPERSILLALAAIDATRSHGGTVLPEAEAALHRAVTASRLLLSVPDVGGNLDWSPTGGIFVTEGPEESGVIDIRDAETGKSVLSFRGHDVDVNDVVFSSDGSMLATTGDDGAARVWDPTTGEQLVAFQDPDGVQVEAPSFSPDGTWLVASWPGDDVVRVIDVATGDLVTEIELPDAYGTSFSPDGERIALACAAQSSALVVDADSGEQLLTLDGHDGEIFRVDWSPDGRWIATGSVDGTARVWDAATGEPRPAITAHAARINSLDWSPDSTRLATGSQDGTATIWEITEDGAQELLTFAALGASRDVQALAFAPDGERLMTSDTAGADVKIWDASTTGGAEWANVPAVRFSNVEFTPDGRNVVVSSGGGVVSISEIETRDQVAEIGPRAGHDDDVYVLDLSDDGQLLATTAPPVNGPVDVWDASTGEHRFAVSDDNVEEVTAWDLEWSGDGQLMAIALNDGRRGEVAIVDRSGAEVGRVREEPGQSVTSVSLSPDGRLLATTREGIARQDTANMDATIWDWERGEVVNTVDGPVGAVIFDPTGTRIATVRIFDGTAEVWDLQTGGKVATLVPPAGTSALGFSPDGTSVATGHIDGSVRLWDTETGLERLVLSGHQSEVITVVFSPDGSMLASNDAEDGLVRVWALDLDELIAIATDRLTRTLTEGECRQFLHVERCPTP